MGWIEILVALGGIGAFLGGIATFYRWVYVPRREKKARQKREIYVPLRDELSRLAACVERFEYIAGLSTKLLKLVEVEGLHALRRRLNGFLERRTTYNDWRQISDDRIRTIIFDQVHVAKPALMEEFEKLGQRHLEEELFKAKS